MNNLLWDYKGNIRYKIFQFFLYKFETDDIKIYKYNQLVNNGYV